jgi:hypothetical protein
MTSEKQYPIKLYSTIFSPYPLSPGLSNRGVARNCPAYLSLPGRLAGRIVWLCRPRGPAKLILLLAFCWHDADSHLAHTAALME